MKMITRDQVENNCTIVIPTERLISRSVAEGIALLAKQDQQSDEGSDRGIWRWDAGWPFRNGRVVSPHQILPSLAVREFTPDTNGKFQEKFNTFRTGPLVLMTSSMFIAENGPETGLKVSE